MIGRHQGCVLVWNRLGREQILVAVYLIKKTPVEIHAHILLAEKATDTPGYHSHHGSGQEKGCGQDIITPGQPTIRKTGSMRQQFMEALECSPFYGKDIHLHTPVFPAIMHRRINNVLAVQIPHHTIELEVMMIRPVTLEDELRMWVLQDITTEFSIILPLHNNIRIIIPGNEAAMPDSAQHITAIQRILYSLFPANFIDVFEYFQNTKLPSPELRFFRIVIRP